MLALSCLSMYCGVAAAKHAATASQGFGRNLRSALFRQIQRFSFADIDRFSSASLITRMTSDVNTMQMTVGMAVAAIFAKPLSTKIGKAEISVISNLFAGVTTLILFFVRPQSVYVYIAFQALSWIGLGIFAMVNWALITDVIDYSEIRNGIREDGSVYALYSFARKLGQAASSGVSGALLTLIGYNAENVTDAVKDGIFNISTLVPAVGLILLAAILWFWYPLHKKQVDENVRILKEKHENS